MTAREFILARIRAALADPDPGPDPGPDRDPDRNRDRDRDRDRAAEEPVARDYLRTHSPDDPAALLDLLHHNLADYRARVHRCTEAELPAVLARLLAERGSRTVAVPPGLPPAWLSATAVTAVPDDGTLTAARLDAVDSVVTGCALAIAETGTIVLDAGPGQGRRLLTLVPDHHLCVVRAPGQVVASVPLALPRLDPARPQTWISGPSATSDIELDRVEGVHGPRTLEVLLVEG
ncbi:lactate utilization protein C [Kitasatospora sp. NPDC127121]|uniref:LutC/YkgG family protein n=1 Tax=Kitasatospora sp. NPDC127121 TaxID=3345371 RepID=UPI0036329C8E